MVCPIEVKAASLHAQRVRHALQPVAVRGIGGGGGNALCAAAHADEGVVAVGIVGKGGYHALG